MSEPDNPRWLNEISDELREDVPVRAAWRSRLLDDVAHARRPSVGDAYDDRIDDADVSSVDAPPRRRRIVLTPLSGLAAALAFSALGAGAMYATLTSRGANAPEIVAGGARGQESAATTVAATSVASTVQPAADRKLVRFALSAPSASRVTLVGSFNEWDPVATPLVRDAATGTWMVSVRLPAGRHVYAFVVDGDVTTDPAAPRAADDDFGSANSVVLVSGSTS
jgi:hypothetical protein